MNRKTSIIALIVFNLLLVGNLYSQTSTMIRDGDANIRASIKSAGNVTPNVMGVQGNASGVPIPVTVSGSATVVCPSTNKCYMDIASVGGISVAAGQAAMAASIPVTMASDQGYQPVSIIGSITFGSGLISSVMNETVSTQLTGLEAVASNYWYISSCQASNGSTTVSTDINLQDGSGGNVLAVIPVPAGSVAGTGVSGAAVEFGIPLKLTVNTGLFAANVTTGSATKISCQGARSTTSR